MKEPLLLYCVFSALCSSKILGCDKKSFFRNTYKFLQVCEIKIGLWKKGGKKDIATHNKTSYNETLLASKYFASMCLCVWLWWPKIPGLRVLHCVFAQIPWRALTPSVFTLCSYPQIKTSSLWWQRFSNRANIKVATVSSKQEYSL